MSLPLKLYKTGGVPVTAAVHKRLRAANQARDAGDWARAAAGYADALDRDPALVHIWIQYGHALKESGELQRAHDAYCEAIRLAPEKAEAHLQLGHLLKRMNEPAAATRSYLAAARLDPNNTHALGELQTVAGRDVELSRQTLLDILQPPGREVQGGGAMIGGVAGALAAAKASLDDLQWFLERENQSGRPELADSSSRLSAAKEMLEALLRSEGEAEEKDADAGPAIVFDASDLISYFKNARLPTGIQRVQIEVISNALRQRGEASVRICCFIERRDDWLEIPAAMFLTLCRLSLTSGDRNAEDWAAALSRLYLTLNAAEPIAFAPGAFLINLGTSWWLQNYFLYVREAKRTHQIRYVPFVHDLIPVMAPEHCTKELTRDFISWALGAFDHADFFFVNSESTRGDLIKVAEMLGRTIDPERIEVVRLDADFRKPLQGVAPRSALETWGLARSPFVLFVSTIESRKNHVGVFDAWLQLMRVHGAKRTPKLVCVGNRGWLNDAVYARLESSDELRDKVVMLSGLSDQELALLYTECLFTLYPSHYEGWGLPVTESLCHGKAPLVSDSSSLPEAGGRFAAYFEAGSSKQLVATLDRLIFKPAEREMLERVIRQDFQPRSWRDVALQIDEAVNRWRGDGQADQLGIPIVNLGAYYPITRNFETRIWPGMGSAEVFRVGSGWWWPDDWGCWTKPQGGTLLIGLPAHHQDLRIYFRLHGLPHLDSAVTVKAADPDFEIEERLRPGEFKWVTLEVPAAHDARPTLHVTLRGSAFEALGEHTGGLDTRVVASGLAGFFICEIADTATRFNFLEAAALGNVNDLSAYRERSTQSSLSAPIVAAMERQLLAAP